MRHARTHARRSARREVHPPAAINFYIVTTAVAVKLPVSGSPARSHADAEGRSETSPRKYDHERYGPHWEAVVDYGAFEVSIPLPGATRKTPMLTRKRMNLSKPWKVSQKLCFALRIKLEYDGLTVGIDLAADCIISLP
jgi:hypothetical protein